MATPGASGECVIGKMWAFWGLRTTMNCKKDLRGRRARGFHRLRQLGSALDGSPVPLAHERAELAGDVVAENEDELGVEPRGECVEAFDDVIRWSARQARHSEERVELIRKHIADESAP